MLISSLGTFIFLFYAITGQAAKLNSLEGYPRWYQELIVRDAAKKAESDQAKVIANS